MKILLIDDSARVREVLRVALASEGYCVIEAANGREGVALFRDFPVKTGGARPRR